MKKARLIFKENKGVYWHNDGLLFLTEKTGESQS